MARRVATPLVATFFVGCCAQSPAPPSVNAPADQSIDVVELSAVEARDRMRAGTLTSRTLTQAYLDRIAKIDDAGPMLNAVIELNPNALADADVLDAERKRGTARGPLHGIPVLLKDQFDVAGMVTSAGALALAEHRPQRDSSIAKSLRRAGAVILGKTNLTEWGNFRGARSTSGWSSRGGQTKNPYVLDRNPCGSSSGTGAAIAASLAAVGVGAETSGSIICPSSVNGLVGLKPTVGLVNLTGVIIQLSRSQDTAGPMGRTVADVALLLNGLVEADTAEPVSPTNRKLAFDYLSFLDRDALKGRRFGMLRQAMGSHPDADALAEKAAATMKAAGAEVVDVKLRAVDANHPGAAAVFEEFLYEFKHGLNAYLIDSGAPHQSLDALIAWNKANAAKVMPFFGQEVLEQAQAKGPITDAAYIKARDAARRLRDDVRNGLLATLAKERLDAVVAPTGQPAWVTDHVLGDRLATGSVIPSLIAALAGTPSITVPVGDSHGLPLGFMFMGRAYSEGDLIGFAYALEQIMKARKTPEFKPTIE
jgi:amidase